MEEMLIKYNEKYDRWCRSDGKIYRQDKNGKFIECKQSKLKSGYLIVNRGKRLYSHRLIWETLKGPIPNGYEIDHINTVRDDNRLENLRCVTKSQNMLNPITNKRKTTSDFGKKYSKHFGYGEHKNIKQYNTEYYWYHRHNNKCRWEA